jgi:hypothetical protein
MSKCERCGLPGKYGLDDKWHCLACGCEWVRQPDKVDLSTPRVSSVTGATRSDENGKGRPSLLPPWTILRLARHFEECSRPGGYPERNWEKGIPLSRFVDSAFRHLEQWWGGDRSEPHEISALWNLLCLVETQHRIAIGLLPDNLDDRPTRTLTLKEPDHGVVESPETGGPNSNVV